MKYLVQEEINQRISEDYFLNFSLEEKSLCLIEIIANARSWWQNFKNRRFFSLDDDLFLYLDGGELTTSLSTKKDSRSAWNGNELKGLDKTFLIAVNLKAGEHIIKLKPDNKPFLKTITISQVKETNKITYIPITNNPAQKGDGRPWLSYIILNLFIAKLSIFAGANKNKRDDDDLKLIINGETQKNENKKAHRDWYWCGKILKNKEAIFSKEINSKIKQFKLDLHADETPFLSKIEIEIKTEVDEELESQEAKRIPSVDDPLWTGDFRDDTDEMLLARLIFGETNNEPREAKIWAAWSVINRATANSWWPKTVKEVILQNGQYDPMKPESPVFKKIISPLDFANIGESDKESWYECYEIARDVISGKIKSPTTATHFVSGDNYKDFFEKNVVPNGQFLKRISATYFYWSPN